MRKTFVSLIIGLFLNFSFVTAFAMDDYLSIDELKEKIPPTWNEIILAQNDIECTIDAVISVPEVETFPVIKVIEQGINSINLQGFVVENSTNLFFFKNLQDKDLPSVPKSTQITTLYEDLLDEEYLNEAVEKARDMIRIVWGYKDEIAFEKLGIFIVECVDSITQLPIFQETVVNFCPEYNGIAYLNRLHPFNTIKDYNYQPSNLVYTFWRDDIDYWGVFIAAPHVIGEYEDDVPLLPFARIQDTIREHVQKGYIQSINEIRLGYICLNDPEHPGEEFYLTPGWVVCGVMNSQPNLPFHPENYSQEQRYTASLLVINAQTGEWYDVNSRDIKTFDANILTWEDVR